MILPTALCFLLILPFPAFATTIATLISDNSITIAADSVLLGTSPKRDDFVRLQICKIRCVRNVCFTGVGRYTSVAIGYDLWQLAEAELRDPGTPEELADRFKIAVMAVIPKLVAVSKKQTPQWYADYLKGSPLMDICLLGLTRVGQRPYMVTHR